MKFTKEEIAKQFKVDRKTIESIFYNQTWSQIKC